MGIGSIACVKLYRISQEELENNTKELEKLNLYFFSHFEIAIL